jgi:N-acetylglucosaminyldiphosphoundecaprenol N-acetyl-beta-D-mannosaminyltransferase
MRVEPFQGRRKVRQQFLGCPIDILTMAETVDVARNAMRGRYRVHHTALNVAKLVNMRRNPILAADVAASDLITMDGMGIVWGARLVGLPTTCRVAGIDLLTEILSLCAREGFRPYFLGATPAVLRRAAERVHESHPAIQLAGMRDGYFSAEDEQKIVDNIRDSGADCLFIGMPTPKKERFLAAHRDELGIPFVMGVGGSFDVLAGHVRRAPGAAQKLGLEWAYRLLQEPRRLWWRYTETNAIFAGLLAHAMLHRGASAMGYGARLGFSGGKSPGDLA